jgi:hypothetical protein
MRLALILMFACGGARPAPPKPQPLDPKGLAKLLDDDLARLGEIAHRLRGKCTATIAELRPHVSRMKTHELEVQHMLEDAQQAAELKQELAAYASRAAGKSDGIAKDLGATYVACGQHCGQQSQRPKDEAPPRWPPPSEPTDDRNDPQPPVRPAPPANIDPQPICQERYQLERVIAELPTYE